MLEALLNQIGADELAALMAVAPHMDEAILNMIAEADCHMGAEESLAALRKIRDTLVLPVPINWNPHEVLALTRWSECWQDDDPNAKRCIHLARAFSTAILLQASIDYEPYQCEDDDSDTLVQFVVSMIFLGEDFIVAARRFLVWLVMTAHGWSGFHAFIAHALFLLTVSLPAGKRGPDDLACLAGWVEAEVEKELKNGSLYDSDCWLLGLDLGVVHANWLVISYYVLVAGERTFTASELNCVSGILQKLKTCSNYAAEVPWLYTYLQQL